MINDIIQELKNKFENDISNLPPTYESDVSGTPEFQWSYEQSGWFNNEVYTNTLLDGKKIYRKTFILYPSEPNSTYPHQISNLDKVIAMSVNYFKEGLWYDTYGIIIFGSTSVYPKVDSTNLIIETEQTLSFNIYGYIDYTKNEEA